MKVKLDTKEQHKLCTLFTIYRSNIVEKANQFINFTLSICTHRFSLNNFIESVKAV